MTLQSEKPDLKTFLSGTLVFKIKIHLVPSKLDLEITTCPVLAAFGLKASWFVFTYKSNHCLEIRTSQILSFSKHTE